MSNVNLKCTYFTCTFHYSKLCSFQKVFNHETLSIFFTGLDLTYTENNFTKINRKYVHITSSCQSASADLWILTFNTFLIWVINKFLIWAINLTKIYFINSINYNNNGGTPVRIKCSLIEKDSKEYVITIPEDTGELVGVIRHPLAKYCSNLPLAAKIRPRYGGEGFSGLKRLKITLSG